MLLSKGQKISLKENFLTIKFERPTSTLEIDTAAFLTQANGKVAGDEDFIFYGNTRHNSGGVTLNGDALELDLEKIPRHVERISLTATIYDADKLRQNFSMIRDAVLKIFDLYDEIATFPLENFTVETAIVLGEVYRYKGAWKFSAVGAGFMGGLASLCKNFGIEVIENAPPSPFQSKTIELFKGQKFNLGKKNSALGEILINLKRSQTSPKSDLNLACLFELTDGTIGAVQALGNYFGRLNYPPYTVYDGNDKKNAAIRVNGKFANKIRRILIYVFVYRGAAKWEESNVIVTVNCPSNPELVLRMDECNSVKYTCAMALLENIGGTFSVEKIVEFFDDAEQMDKAFDWGLRWTVGSKD